MAKRATRSVTITARVPAALAKKLETYAKMTKLTRSRIIEDMLDRYVDGEIAFAEAVNEGRKELDAGLGIPHEEAMKQIRDHIAMRKRERRKAA